MFFDGYDIIFRPAGVLASSGWQDQILHRSLQNLQFISMTLSGMTLGGGDYRAFAAKQAWRRFPLAG